MRRGVATRRDAAEVRNIGADQTIADQPGQEAVRWPKRVTKGRLRRLYQSIPTGLLDEALLDDVGMSLLVRCQAILRISQAHRGRVLCPVCDRAGREVWIARQDRSLEEEIACQACGWRITWGQYVRTFQRRQLNEGGAGPAFRRFVEHYPLARTPWQRMLEIDRLIHEFHFSLRNQPDLPTRAVCVNLIEGKLTDVVAFLNELSGSTGEHGELAGRHRAWQALCHRAGQWHPR